MAILLQTVPATLSQHRNPCRGLEVVGAVHSPVRAAPRVDSVVPDVWWHCVTQLACLLPS